MAKEFINNIIYNAKVVKIHIMKPINNIISGINIMIYKNSVNKAQIICYFLSNDSRWEKDL